MSVETRERPKLPQRVQVVIRVRPALNGEKEEDTAVTAEEGRRVQVLIPEKEGEKEKIVTQPTAKAFEFDHCLGPHATQDDVYKACNLEALVEAALEGYSVTLFAYGQTGSGKTHSVIGPRIGQTEMGGDGELSDIDEQDGVLSRAYAYAFTASEALEGVEVRTSISCAEIYNDQVSDLLHHGASASANMPIRYDKVHGFFVEGLTSKKVSNYQQTIAVMHKGLATRQMGSHNLNLTSTRSHCIMTLLIESRRADQDGNPGPPRYGRLSLVDLAGSERIKETGTSGRKQLAETGAINKSLFALGKVIAALCQRAKGNANVFVPFRDSKLTQLLYSSLKGTGRALMLGCCAPSKAYADETLNTLQFASMALRVKSEPIVIMDPQDQMVMDLKNTIAELRNENHRMADALTAISEGQDASSVIAKLTDPATPHAPMGTGPRRSSAPGNSSYGRRSVSSGRAAPSGRSPSTGRPSHSTQRSNSGTRGSPRTSSLFDRFADKIPKRHTPPKTAPETGAEHFPELAALEAAFQARLAGVTSGQDEDATEMETYGMAPLPAPAATSSPSKATLKSSGEELAALLMADMDGSAPLQTSSPQKSSSPRLPDSGSSAATNAVPMADSPTAVASPTGAAVPEEMAVRWARRNRWFGTDQEMTEFAYQIHEQLVDHEGIDTDSDQYYAELDRRVEERFPGRVEASRSKFPPASPSKQVANRSTPPLRESVSSSLRMSIKAHVPSAADMGPRYAARAAGVRRRLAELGTGGSLPPASPGSSPHAREPPAGPPLCAEPRDSPVSPGVGSPLRKSTSMPRNSRARGQFWDQNFNGDVHARHRQDIIVDLKLAKEEAERERKRIMKQIQKTLQNRWH